MDAIRRGAMAKMGRYVAGAAGLVAGAGRRNTATGAMQSALGLMNNIPISAYPGDMARPVPQEPSPMMRARYKAAAPLEDQIAEIEGYKGYRLSNFIGHAEGGSYLPALRSTSPVWRASVAMDKCKARATAVQTIRDQIEKMLRSPFDALEDVAKQAIQGFLEEMQKP